MGENSDSGLAQTPFQREFEVNAEFYEGAKIRAAIQRHFPLGSNGFEGLAYIIAQQQALHPATDEELVEAMPDTPPGVEDMPAEFHRAFAYVVAESRHPETASVSPVTVFQPTDLGYICVEQRIE